MKKGIVYYTHNRCEERIVQACRNQIDRAAGDIPIVNVSQYPLNWRQNIVVELPAAVLSMFKQQLIGLEAIDADVVFFCEHDVLYHPSHFDFEPPREDVYYFNLNVWAVNVTDGRALYYDGMKMTSGLVAHKKILIEHYTKKIAWVEEMGYFSRRVVGYEPGKVSKPGRENDYEWDTFRSEHPNVDLKNGQNITRKRFTIGEYRCRRQLKDSWRLEDAVPGWGITKCRVDDFLREHY